MTSKQDVMVAALEDALLSLDELCRVGCVSPQWVIERVEAGLLAERGGAPETWRFDAVVLRRVRRMASLERDFDAAPELAALVADLQDEIERLRSQLGFATAAHEVLNKMPTGLDRFLRRLALLTLIGAALTVVLGYWRGPTAPLWLTAQAAPRAVTPRGPLEPDERATIDLFERARDSVVFISTRQQVRDFWTRNVFSVPRGTGSGFIWDDQGHVVTNLHVVQGASEATVRLADGRDYKATLVGVSPTHDLAVLRIGVRIKPPPPVPLGTSHDLKVGQKVYAIGNPFGLDWTLTTGIVSALDRSLPNEAGVSIEHLIQTDASINPGNSGGPLLDSAGRLIGINTAIYSPSGASVGIGFAVPVDTVNRVVPELIAHGRYLRPTLGIGLDDGINQRLVDTLGTPGVYVLHVEPGSAAARAGLRGARMTDDGELIPGDVIVAVEGRPVTSVGALLGRLDDFKIGATVRLTVLRGGKSLTLGVTLQGGV